MGREADCMCRWGGRAGRVTAFLESRELVVRGDIRDRVPLAALESVRANGDTLELISAGERIELAIGASPARRWAAAITAPPPTLARKLGISAATRVHSAGPIDDDELRAALTQGAPSNVALAGADLVIVRIDDGAALLHWLQTAAPCRPDLPIWVVYVKGREAPLGEARVRELMRSSGFIDTKVAAVSRRLAALRFVMKQRR